MYSGIMVVVHFIEALEVASVWVVETMQHGKAPPGLLKESWAWRCSTGGGFWEKMPGIMTPSLGVHDRNV